jgi:hypothetical protein
MKYTVIRYSSEHIHVVTENKNRCYLSRNWNRCTADHSVRLKDIPSHERSRNRSYYDGERWVKAEKPE